jgi:hypothetical protein
LEKALWEKGTAYLTTKLIPVIPVIPVVPASSDFNSRPGLSYGVAWFMMPVRLLISFITDRKPMKRKASMNNYAITDTRCCCSF